MSMKGRQRRAKVITVEELPSTACVFSENTIHRSENFDRPAGGVGKVAYWGGYDVQGAHAGSIAPGPNQGRICWLQFTPYLLASSNITAYFDLACDGLFGFLSLQPLEER